MRSLLVNCRTSKQKNGDCLVFYFPLGADLDLVVWEVVPPLVFLSVDDDLSRLVKSFKQERATKDRTDTVPSERFCLVLPSLSRRRVFLRGQRQR